ncbi:MAG TPA: cytochrome P450 [Myxococcota bacterium]|nr:cytochrome P450 [Myxococcota bacterium]
MDFDINDLDTDPARRDAALTRLRREDPVHWDAANGFWLLTRHSDVRAASKDPELYSSQAKGPWHTFEIHFSMQALDGPEHRRQRGIASKGFTPRMVRRLRESAHATIHACIDAVLARGGCEFVSALASPVPLRLIADMLGLPAEHFELFQRWSDVTASSDAVLRSSHGFSADQARLEALLREEAELRRREPRDDLISAVVAAEAEGVLDWGGAESFTGFAKDDLVSFAQFILIAGNETTRNAISRGMLALIEHPEQRALLRARPGLLPRAIDEILRWSSPVRALRRVAMRDTELRGRKLREGDSVLLLYMSANRDEEMFDDPFAFRVDRSPNEHITFGIGPHYCLGANLARMEIEVVIGALLERLPDMRLAPGARVREARNPILAAIDQMMVEF